MRISDWSSDVCSSDLVSDPPVAGYLAELLARLLAAEGYFALPREDPDSTTAELWALRDTLKIQERILADFNRSMAMVVDFAERLAAPVSATEAPSAFRTPLYTQLPDFPAYRSEEHTSELQSLMRISYAVFCLKKKKKTHNIAHIPNKITKQNQEARMSQTDKQLE